MKQHPRPSRRAFTLIEAIATITILAALGSVASSMILSATTAWRDAAAAAQLHDEASTALERIAKELRAIEPDTSISAAAPRIATLSPTSITYNAGSSIALSGTTLQLSDSGAPAVPLLTGVTTFALRPFNAANEPLAANLSGAACQAIRRIEIELSVQRSGVTHTLRTRVFLRGAMAGTN